MRKNKAPYYRPLHYRLHLANAVDIEPGMYLPSLACGLIADYADYTQYPKDVTCPHCKKHPDVAKLWSTIEENIEKQFR